MKPERQRVLDGAMDLSRRHGIAKLRRKSLARHLHLAQSTITYHWGTMTDLRLAVMRTAVRERDIVIIAQGFAERHPATRNVSPTIRKLVAQLLCS